MKKITLIILLLMGMLAFAQTNYNFSFDNQPYQHLTDPVSLNNGQIWDDPEFAIPLGFDFHIGEHTFDTVYIVEWGLGGILSNTPNDTGIGVELAPMWQDLIDLGYESGSSLSEIAYQTEGSPGNRITKIEWKNAGFWEDTTTSDFLNFQVWFHESTNILEYRYGPSQINNPADSFEGFSGPFVYFVTSIDFDLFDAVDMGYVLSENPASPTLIVLEPGETVNIDDVAFQGMIPNGMVYRFIPGELATENFEKNAFVFYPNPTKDYFTIYSSDDVKQVTIYNHLGQGVGILEKTNNVFDISHLSKGVYWVEIETPLGKSVKKIIKK